jgi:hypothetical protein
MRFLKQNGPCTASLSKGPAFKGGSGSPRPSRLTCPPARRR